MNILPVGQLANFSTLALSAAGITAADVTGDVAEAKQPHAPGPRLVSSRNKTEVFVEGGESFPAMEALLGSARSSIRMDYFLFSGREATRMTDIMVDRAKAGVEVRVLLDPKMGVLPKYRNAEKAEIARLRAAGAQVEFYPLKALVPGKPLSGRIDHDKFIVVDGRSAIAGGMNILDDFLNNHDVMVKFQGPAATQLKQQFDEAWKATGGQPPCATDGPAPEEQGDALVRVLGTGVGGRRSAEDALLERLAGAKKRIYVEMFFLTSPRLIAGLIEAHKRGVDVRVLADPGDHGRFIKLPLPDGFPNMFALNKLRDAGVQVRWYKLRPDQVHDHLKLSLIDNAAMVGSLNWTDSALQHNAETDVEIEGGAAYQRLMGLFVDDWNNHSRPVAPSTFFRWSEAAALGLQPPPDPEKGSKVKAD